MNKKSSPKSLHTQFPEFNFLFKTMKISMFLLFFCIFSVHAEKIASQNSLFTISKKNVKLENIIGEVEKQSDYLFVYSKNIDVNQEISVNVDKSTLAQTLNKMFDNTNIGYEIDGSYIVLSTKGINDTPAITQQRRTVKGSVTDKAGEPLIGASVMIKGTTQGAITDVNGQYNIELSDNAVELVASYLGYITLEVPIAKKQKSTFGSKKITSY